MFNRYLSPTCQFNSRDICQCSLPPPPKPLPQGMEPLHIRIATTKKGGICPISCWIAGLGVVRSGHLFAKMTSCGFQRQLPKAPRKKCYVDDVFFSRTTVKRMEFTHSFWVKGILRGPGSFLQAPKLVGLRGFQNTAAALAPAVPTLGKHPSDPRRPCLTSSQDRTDRGVSLVNEREIETQRHRETERQRHTHTHTHTHTHAMTTPCRHREPLKHKSTTMCLFYCHRKDF